MKSATSTFVIMLFFCIGASAQWQASFAVGLGNYVSEDDLSSDVFLTETSVSRSEFNISEGLSGLALRGELAYGFSDRWSLAAGAGYMSASGQYFEEKFIRVGDFEFDDFEADAEIDVLDISLTVNYDLLSSDDFKLRVGLGPTLVSRSHTYLVLQNFVVENDILTFTQRVFDTVDATEIGAILLLRLDKSISDSFGLFVEGTGSLYNVSDQFGRVMLGARVDF